MFLMWLYNGEFPTEMYESCSYSIAFFGGDVFNFTDSSGYVVISHYGFPWHLPDDL